MSNLHSRLIDLEHRAALRLGLEPCRCAHEVCATVDAHGRVVCDRCWGSVDPRNVQLPPGAVPGDGPEENQP